MRDVATAFRTPKPRLLFVASVGGHLEQIGRFKAASTASPDSVVVTFESAQADSLFGSEGYVKTRFVGSRDWRNSMRSIGFFRRLLATEHFDGVVSTGAAIAVPAFLAARSLGVPTLYVESVSRVAGPSLTGRVATRSRLATHSWSQHPTWARGRWEFSPGVLAQYEAVERDETSQGPTFCTLGTLQQFRFDSAVDAVKRAGRDIDSTIWQLGSTDRDDLRGITHAFVSSEEFDHDALAADVVVSHAGVGSVLRLLDLGIFPILLIRRSGRNEQIDDHQEQIAGLVNALGIGIGVDVDDLRPEHFERAARHAVRQIGPVL